LVHSQATSGQNINVDWSPDGTTIAVGNKLSREAGSRQATKLVDQLQFFDVRKWKTLRTMKFPFVINEIRWNYAGNFFILSSGSGSIQVLNWPELYSYKEIAAHTASIYCLEMDPTGKYMAAGSADSLVSIWDQKELACVRTINNFDYACRTMSFSFDGQLIALASEDPMLVISHIETGELVYSTKCEYNLNAVDWHPKLPLLAYVGEEKDRRGFVAVKIFQYGNA